MKQLAGVLLGVFGFGCVQDAARVEEYKGWSNVLFLDAPEPKVSGIAVPAIGGRIISFSRGGENILFMFGFANPLPGCPFRFTAEEVI